MVVLTLEKSNLARQLVDVLGQVALGDLDVFGHLVALSFERQEAEVRPGTRGLVLLEEALGRHVRVAQQHADCHRSDSARHWRYVAGYFGCTLEINVTTNSRLSFGIFKKLILSSLYITI